MKEVTIAAAADILRGADEVRIVTHKHPDGDAIGSSCGLAVMLQSLGKKAEIFCDDEFAARFSHATAGVLSQTVSENAPIVTVDLADPTLAGEYSGMAENALLAIDHHISNLRYAEFSCVDAKAAAACEVLFCLAEELKIPFTKHLANCLYTGLCTDTGCFQYSNVTPHTLRAAATLLENGADTAEINRLMFDNKSKARITLEQATLNSIVYEANGKIALSVLPLEVFQQSGAEEADINGLSSIPRQIEGVELALFLREMGENDYKISVRSGEEANASEFCAQFGGGGHARAAGCRINAPLDAVKEQLLTAAKELFV